MPLKYCSLQVLNSSVTLPFIIFFLHGEKTENGPPWSIFLSICHFLTVDATIGNQAFSHDRCNIFPGLSQNKTNDTFFNSLRKNDVEAQVEFTLKVLERARVACY